MASIALPYHWNEINKLLSLLKKDKNLIISFFLKLLLWMEERPPVWRVTANILNKQSQTADKGWSSSLGIWARC